MNQEGPNIPASVRRRLYNIAQKRGDTLDRVMIRFAMERLLFRLSQSPHSQRFVLKGAMLFAVWSDVPHRPTRDLDLLGFGPSEAHEVKTVFETLIGMRIAQDDGLVFSSKGVSVENIIKEDAYSGLRVKMTATLEGAHIPIQIDIGYGQAVTPGPEKVSFPNLLPEFPAPQIRAYPIYTVLAEKIHAMVHLSLDNSRMKDFYDVWYLSHNFNVDVSRLRTAVQRTFKQRNTDIPLGVPVALTPQFATAQQALWSRFLDRNRLPEPAGTFAALLEKLQKFIMPVFGK